MISAKRCDKRSRAYLLVGHRSSDSANTWVLIGRYFRSIALGINTLSARPFPRSAFVATLPTCPIKPFRGKIKISEGSKVQSHKVLSTREHLSPSAEHTSRGQSPIKPSSSGHLSSSSSLEQEPTFTWSRPASASPRSPVAPL